MGWSTKVSIVTTLSWSHIECVKESLRIQNKNQRTLVIRIEKKLE